MVNNYSNTSISNIGIDDIKQEVGTVTRLSDGSVRLSKKSQCTFSYSFDTNMNTLKCDSLLLRFIVDSSTQDIGTRYNTNIAIDITVHYFDEAINENGVSEGFVDSSYKFSRFWPSLIHEDNGYINNFEIDNLDKYVKSIAMTLSNGNDNDDVTVDFKEISLFESRTVQQVVSDTYGWSAVVDTIDVRPNGYSLKYDGVKEETTLLIDIEDIEGTPTLVQIIVNSTKDSEKVIKIA